jgi:hypothetical protein
MVGKFHCLLFTILLIAFVSSRNVQFDGNKNLESIPTSGKVHLNIHENGYSADEKYKYINECVQKCMQNRGQQSKTSVLDNGRDNCIQTQCRIYERRR